MESAENIPISDEQALDALLRMSENQEDLEAKRIFEVWSQQKDGQLDVILERMPSHHALSVLYTDINKAIIYYLAGYRDVAIESLEQMGPSSTADSRQDTGETALGLMRQGVAGTDVTAALKSVCEYVARKVSEITLENGS